MPVDCFPILKILFFVSVRRYTPKKVKIFNSINILMEKTHPWTLVKHFFGRTDDSILQRCRRLSAGGTPVPSVARRWRTHGTGSRTGGSLFSLALFKKFSLASRHYIQKCNEASRCTLYVDDASMLRLLTLPNWRLLWLGSKNILITNKCLLYCPVMEKHKFSACTAKERRKCFKIGCLWIKVFYKTSNFTIRKCS